MKTIEEIIKEVKANPCVRTWLKKQLIEAESRDCLDASRDAELLAALLKARADAAIYGEEKANLNLCKKGYNFN